jgi:hypothetical protein
MSDIHYISEKKEEASLPTELVAGQVVTQEMTPVEKMIPLDSSIESAVSEENLPKPETETELVHGLRKTTRRRQSSAKLGQLIKLAKRNGVEIYEMRNSIESLDRVARIAARSNLQSMKQLRLQLIQLRNQVMRIQKDIRRVGTFPALRMRIRKIKVSDGKTARKSRSKKSDLTPHAKTKRRRRTR